MHSAEVAPTHLRTDRRGIGTSLQTVAAEAAQPRVSMTDTCYL